jgi:nucleoid-associated protein YgaU
MAAACAAPTPRWRDDAHLLMLKARQEGADQLLPAEFKSVEDTLIQGEAILLSDGVEEAEPLFRFALAKGRLLEADTASERRRRQEAEEAGRREAARLELEQLRAREEEDRRHAQEEAARKARLEAEAAQAARKKAERLRPAQERPLASHRTVKRGETLPQIAAQPEVYNDASLWPLLYRANRDQISNPRHIWPGQVLRIPRILSRDDLLEARRYSREKPLY